MNLTISKFFSIAFIVLLNHYISFGQSLIIKEAYPFNRNVDIDVSGSSLGEHVFLNNRYEVLSFVIKNVKSKKVDFKITTNVKDDWDLELRELMEIGTWYSKGAKKLLDPAILVRKNDGAFVSSVGGNTVKKFLIIIKVPLGEAINNSTINVNVTDQFSSKTSLKFAYKTIGVKQPITGDFSHVVFTNVYNNVNFPAMMLDLSKNYVNLIEFPIFPDVVFNAKGQVMSVKWANTDRYLNVIKKHPNIDLLIYWQPFYKKFKSNTESQNVPYLSPEWFTAFNGVLSSFIEHAESLGIPEKKIKLMIMDEVHSKTLSPQIDKSVEECLLIAKSVKAKFPSLMQFNTFSNNTQSKDVKSLIDYSSTFIQHWPLPTVSTSLGKRLNPAMEYNTKTKSVYSNFRNKGKNVFNYHITKGKSDNIATDELLFPVISILSDNNGVGWWAYNSFSGSSWSDIDGKNLDYSFIYRGDDPKIAQFTSANITEGVVPSLRWLAARNGIQNAMLLQFLKNSMSKLNNDQRKELNSIISAYKNLVDKDNNPVNKSSITIIKIDQALSKRLNSLSQGINN